MGTGRRGTCETSFVFGCPRNFLEPPGLFRRNFFTPTLRRSNILISCYTTNLCLRFVLPDQIHLPALISATVHLSHNIRRTMGLFNTEKKEKTKISTSPEDSSGFNLMTKIVNRPYQRHYPTQAMSTPSSSAPKQDGNDVMVSSLPSDFAHMQLGHSGSGPSASAALGDTTAIITPPPQIVQVNQEMVPASTPSPPAAAAACDSGSTSSAPMAALDAAANPDPLTQGLHNSPESNDRSPPERLGLDDEAVKFVGVPVIDFTDKALLNEACRDGGCFQVSRETIEKTAELFPRISFWDNSPALNGHKVLEVVSEILELKVHDTWWLQEDGHGQHVAMNYYPPRTDRPGLTRGVVQAGHTDPNALTIHLLDQESPASMQIFRQGRWMDVEPHPGALLVTIGDKIEALSKGKYKSARYRMTVSPQKERISLPLGSFGCREGNATSTPSSSTGKSPTICI